MRYPTAAVCIAVVGLLSLAACGGGGSGPMAPTPAPGYAGTWTGTYTVSSCTNSGFFADAGLCSSVLNSIAAVTFTLAQADRTITGAFSLGSLNSPQVTAVVASDGSLTLTGLLQQGVFTVNTTWTLQQPAEGTLTGQTRQIWTASGQSGEGVLLGSILNVMRTSG